MSRKKEADPFKALPKRVQGIITRCRSGEVLCVAFKAQEIEEREVFWFEPSQARATPASARRAIVSGFLAPNADSLFGADLSQSYRAVSA